ncbi:sugar transferase [Rubellimicrobium arenae]|uniref:sugar transferase n=1 Tax=Rubellimicrobium arenae TaxID=2817372 RepID=UPI001B30AD97|nr:sugar transferase [Rubellimicrobium arenae]
MSSFGGDAIDLSTASSLPAAESWSPSLEGFRARQWTVQGLLLAGDVLGYLAADTVLRRLGWLVHYDPAAWRFEAVVAATCLVQFAAASLYPGYGLQEYEQLRRRLTIGVATTFAAVVVAKVVSSDGPALSGAVAVLLLALALQTLIRSIVVRQLHRRGLWGLPVNVLGPPDLSRKAAASLRANWKQGLVPVSPTEPAMRSPVAAVLTGSIPPREELHALLRVHGSVIVLADRPDLRFSGLQPMNLGGRVGLMLQQPHPSLGALRLRRVVDLAIAVPALVVALPLMALAAVTIRLIDRGPAFYMQDREGFHGRTVRVIKLRTMYQDAERRLQDLLESDDARRLEWETHFKLRDDPRILPVVGKLLRKTSCDELPQLFNVIVGQMSVVGPRPFPDYHLQAMDAEFRLKRRSVPPGLTGLWQVSDRSDADLARQQQLDDFYIDNQSFWFDWHILLRTVHAVLGRGGAY